MRGSRSTQGEQWSRAAGRHLHVAARLADGLLEHVAARRRRADAVVVQVGEAGVVLVAEARVVRRWAHDERPLGLLERRWEERCEMGGEVRGGEMRGEM